MYPIIVRLGPIHPWDTVVLFGKAVHLPQYVTIYSFGLMMAVAFLVSGLVISKEFRRKGYDHPNLASSIILWAAVGGLVGARLWVIVDDLDAFLEAPLRVVVSGAGFVWYGGLIGGLVGVSWVIHRERLPWFVVADTLAVALPLGHAIGRIGCQLAGDGDWGTVTNLPWGMAYPNAIIGWEYDAGVRVHPTPLYEAALYIGIFAVLWQVRDRLRRPGMVLSLYFFLAGMARFLIEFVRISPRVLWGLTGAQLFSIGLVAVAIALLVRPRAVKPA